MFEEVQGPARQMFGIGDPRSRVIALLDAPARAPERCLKSAPGFLTLR